MNRAIRSSSRPIFSQWRMFKLSEKEKYGNSYVREFATLYPGIVASGIFFVCCAVYSAIGVKKLGTEHFANKPFKECLTIIRPDDPEVERLRYYSHMYNENYKRPAK